MVNPQNTWTFLGNTCVSIPAHFKIHDLLVKHVHQSTWGRYDYVHSPVYAQGIT